MTRYLLDNNPDAEDVPTLEADAEGPIWNGFLRTRPTGIGSRRSETALTSCPGGFGSGPMSMRTTRGPWR
jgi:hypothetical protein